MQWHYVYFLAEPASMNFDDGFEPELTPAEMLSLGVFSGKYLTDYTKEYCRRGDLECRRKQRRALLHWACDSRQL
jgi:hypothetical protein